MIACCYGAAAQQLTNSSQQRNSSTLSHATSFFWVSTSHAIRRTRAHTHTHTHTHTKPPSRNPQNEWSTRASGCYLHNTTHKHQRRTSLPSAGFEPAFPAMELPQTYALDLTATGIVCVIAYCSHFHPIDNKTQFVVPPRTER